MKKLIYRLSSSRSFANLLSMLAQLEEKRRVMFPKSSVFAVVALAAFVSLGAFLFPQVGQAQECVWDCDLGSDILDNPWGNSPGYDIVYCFDQDCVKRLTDSNGNPIFTGTIPTASVSQKYSDTCPSSGNPNTLELGGTVVALLRDKTGLHRESAAEATLSIIVKNVNCTGSAGSTVLFRAISVNESRTAVFDAASNITILAAPQLNAGNSSLSAPKGWSGCPTDKKTGVLSNTCPFPLGIVEFTRDSTLSAALPQAGFFAQSEVYHAVESARFVGIRDCKGDANSTDPKTITCTTGGTVAVGGGQSLALFNLPGNWSGAGDKTFNPKSSTSPFDIGPTPLFDDIVFTDPDHPVTASANGGIPIDATSCNLMRSQQTLRCSFPAKNLLPNGCTSGDPVDILVKGRLRINNTDFKFESEDHPTCNNG
jgi:hypothetical protein